MNRDDRMVAYESDNVGTQENAGMATKEWPPEPHQAEPGGHVPNNADRMRINIESDKLGNFTDEKSKNILINALKKQIVKVSFTKADGKLREMSCTLRESFLPEITKEGATTEAKKAVNGDVLPVFDVEKKGWRSFRFDSIKNVSFEL